jgi:uncharacterized protein (TIGR01244 family)
MTLHLRRIDDAIAVAPQIDPADLETAREAGYVAIVNNRPDAEEPGQPSGDAIRAAAEAAGLRYTEIPVTHAGFSWPQVEAMATALAEAGGPVLAYCRSGTRSCNLWALAEAKNGGDPGAIAAAARNAGYDLTGLRPLLDQVAGRAEG